MTDELLLDVHNVRRSFPRAGGAELLVLDGVELSLKQGEIVGLLGRSGSGKSTFLRLIRRPRPAAGRHAALYGPSDRRPGERHAMVFQSFALFPWLTVLENVQLGLEAPEHPVGRDPHPALAAIDLIGLDGYENAYPRELSGGMRQRVGFARAMVVHPNILLLTSPFSALDVLTAENLRTDLLELWGEGRLPIKGMILVTHNIEEAVLMCDRVLLFSTNPRPHRRRDQDRHPRPRERTDTRFENYVDQIYTEMTARQRSSRSAGTGLATLMTHVSPNLISASSRRSRRRPITARADLPEIASDLQLEIDELFPIAEALQLLRLARWRRRAQAHPYGQALRRRRAQPSAKRSSPAP